MNRPDVNELKAMVNTADPNAFVVIVQGQQARGGTLPQVLRRLAPKYVQKPLVKTAHESGLQWDGNPPNPVRAG